MARFNSLLFFVLGCMPWNCAKPSETNHQEQSPAHTEVPASSVTDASVSENEENLFDRAVLDARGLIVLGEYEESSGMLRFYNRDGTVWHEFTFYYDDKDGHFEYENADFLPFSFHPDYFTLAIRLVGEDSKYYEVVVNEEKPLRKYIKKSDKKFKFVTWQKHILERFAIDFDQTRNPIRLTPGGPPKAIRTLDIDRYGAKDFDGGWLKIEWDVSGNEHDEDSRTDFGWVRWRNGNRLLIDWFYFA